MGKKSHRNLLQLRQAGSCWCQLQLRDVSSPWASAFTLPCEESSDEITSTSERRKLEADWPASTSTSSSQEPRVWGSASQLENDSSLPAGSPLCSLGSSSVVYAPVPACTQLGPMWRQLGMVDQAEALEWSLIQIRTPPTTSWVTLSNT